MLFCILFFRFLSGKLENAFMRACGISVSIWDGALLCAEDFDSMVNILIIFRMSEIR